MAVATVALVLSLGGTGWAVATLPANSVGTKQLKKGAVVTAKLADHAVTGIKVKGDLPSAGIAGLNYATNPITVPGHTAVAATANCRAGTVPIGGGAELPHSIDQFMLDSHPVMGQGWQAGIGNAGDAPAAVTIYAVCAKSGSATATVARQPNRVVRLGAFSR